MNRPRDQLLAGAGLAEEQHRGIGVGHQLDRPEHLLHRRRAAEDLAEVQVGVERLAQVDVLALELVGALAVGDVADDHDDVRRVAGAVDAQRARSAPRTTGGPPACRADIRAPARAPVSIVLRATSRSGAAADSGSTSSHAPAQQLRRAAVQPRARPR